MVPCRFELSKHSIWRGGTLRRSSRCSVERIRFVWRAGSLISICLSFSMPVQPGVALRQFQKTQLVAPLRHGERDVFPQASRWGERDDYLARELARQPLGDRPDRISQHVARRVFESRFQLDRERVDDRPVGYAHEVAEGGVLVRDQREHVHVRQRVAHYDRLALVGGQDLDPFLVLRGLLEAHRVGGLAHFLFQVAHRVASIAAQQRSDHADAAAVVLLALQSDARPLQLPIWYWRQTL